MKIQLTPNIMIKQCDCCPFLWDLVWTFKAKRCGQMKDCENILANGLNFESIVKRIADFELEISEEDYLTLKEYTEKYQEIQDKAWKELKEFLKQNKINN